MKNDITKGIKILSFFFGLCFLGIIVYLTYFNIFVAPGIENRPENPRVALAEREVVRGSIVDRNEVPIVWSEGNEENQKRKYKSPEAYAHITGYNSRIYNKTGIEKAYNDALIGRTVGYDVIGAFFRTLKEEVGEDEKRGMNVKLTIDSKAQEAAYKAFGNDKGAAVAIDPSTGEVIALVSAPAYNPENIDANYSKYLSDNKGNPFVNRALQGYYPPGSVFKMVTSASALDNIPDITTKKFNCNGRLKIGNYVLTDDSNARHGNIDLERGFRVSCNYTFGSVGLLLGYNRLKETAENFMFNRAITPADGDEYLNIRAGSFKIQDANDKAYLAQNAIGQNGVTTNPMHMALVTAAIANEGVMMKPYIVEKVEDRYGIAISTSRPEILSHCCSDNSANKVKKYMVETVKSGTAGRMRISGITVGAKTGSAENTLGEETHSWLTAFAPYDNPKIAVAVIVENAGIGGGRAADIAKKTIEAYLK